MDERDFAELISVFLKGSESDGTQNTIIDNEKNSTVSDTSSNEAEIRKNIIEALAEKIRESQVKNSSQPDQANNAPSLEQEIVEPKTVTTEPETIETVEAIISEASMDNDTVSQESNRKSDMISKSIDDFTKNTQTGELASTPANAEVETGANTSIAADVEAGINDPANADNVTDTSALTYVDVDLATATAAATGDKEFVTASKDIVTEEEVATLLLGDNQEEIVSLQHILDRFLKLDGTIAALLVSRDGFTVEHVSKMELDLDTISAVVATGFSYLDKIGNELDHGDLRIAMLEYLNGPIIISPLVHDIVLVIVASQWATLGRIRLEIKKQTDELIVNL